MNPPPSRLPRLLALVEVAARLQVSIKTLRRWISRGELPVHHLGRQIRISEDDLLLFISKHRS